MAKSLPYNSIINISGQYESSLLTFHGSLIGAIELSGIDPASCSEDNLILITNVIKIIFDMLPVDCAVSNYYIHYDNERIEYKKYENPQVNVLINKRIKFLNEHRNLNGSKLYWVIELFPDENLNKLMSLTFLKTLFGAIFDEESRQKLKILLSSKSSYIAEEKALFKQKERLFSILKDIDAKLNFISFDNEIQTPDQLWNLSKFLVNFNIDYLHKKNESTPIEHWNCLLADGSINQIVYKGHDLLKISGVKPIYIKIAHVTQFGNEDIPFGIWATKKSTPVLNSGNYVYFTRMIKMSDMQRALLFKMTKDGLNRSQISFSDMMSGVNPESKLQQKIDANPKLKQDMENLEIEKSSGKQYCYFVSSIILFEENPEKLISSIDDMNRSLTDNMHLLWENAGALIAYQRAQIGYHARSFRDFKFTTTQSATCSLIYRSNTGRKTWGQYLNEYAYIFESIDKSPFYFSSYVNEKDLITCVGPTRSGKSFARNVLASHILKYGGIYIAIDVDAGSEPLAQFYSKDSAVFKLPREDENKAGFNPFDIADSMNDKDWIMHFTALVRDLLKLNDSEELKTFTAEEQLSFDQAVIFTLMSRDDPDSKTPACLSSVASQAGVKVKEKLKRFLRGGQFGHIFDNDKDAIGILDKPISVYNFSAVKDNVELLGLVQREALFRVTRIFEDPRYLGKPKKLDMDECQYSFTVEETSAIFEKKVRTWFKQLAGINLWTQSPEHYLSMNGWGTIRASASTFLFMPDNKAELNYENYHKAFGLTKDECKLISNLKPRQQIYLKQDDIEVAKVVSLNVESEQYIICTSTAEEMAIRNEVMKKMENEEDFGNVISATIKEINNKLGKNLQET